MQRALCRPALRVLIASLGASLSCASQQPAKARDHAASVVMLSDIHFDPLHDPSRVPLLDKAPVYAWHSILAAPDSTDQAARFDAVQAGCSGKDGVDTPYHLLESSLLAAKGAARAAFVTVSGDLLVHDLDCRYRADMGLPASTADDQSASAAFAEKTTVFVMQEVEDAFPHVPVYFALGNNDSRCNHNRLDWHDRYLSAAATAMVAGLRGASADEKRRAFETFQSAGYYSVTLPPPFRASRLVVIDDIYSMPKFTPCGGGPTDGKAAQEQASWLDAQLQDARARHTAVWLMGHLPPVVNPDASLAGTPNVCDGGKAVRFQSDATLAEQIKANADVIAIGIFGHTHMDELHLIAGTGGAVPIKMVASVTPVSGNLPSFTVATVNTATAKLMDYRVVKGSNASGVAEQWATEYTFTSEYLERDASTASIADVFSQLKADDRATHDVSRLYREHVLKGVHRQEAFVELEGLYVWPGQCHVRCVPRLCLRGRFSEVAPVGWSCC